VDFAYAVPAMAPLDQEALTRWLRDRLTEGKEVRHKKSEERLKPELSPKMAGEQYVYGLAVARMKMGDLPELDDVEAVIKEFRAISPPMGGSPFREGQTAALEALEKKISELMA
jgi:hypothetical protein